MTHLAVKRREPLCHRRDGDVEHVTVGGKTFIVDAEDLRVLEGWSISVLPAGYVMLRGSRAQCPRPFRSLSRLLMNVSDDREVDHINCNPLDNRKCNLRACTRAENLHNSQKPTTGKNLFKGVGYRKNRWEARIHYDGYLHYLGRFLTAEEAAATYNAKAIEVAGRFARINVLESPGQTTPMEHLTGDLNESRP